jgi:hypothetical protein
MRVDLTIWQRLGGRWSRAGRAAVATSAILLAVVGVALASSGGKTNGEIGPSLGITANGRQLDPVGRLTQVGNFPTGSALTPDGRTDRRHSGRRLRNPRIR